MFNLKIADIVIAVDNKYPEIYEISREYMTDEPPSISVCADESDIEKERPYFDSEISAGELESIAIYRKIADEICAFDAIVFHGSVVLLDERAYLFTAKSGVGKTTHSKLWLSHFGKRVKILNGDKPVIRIMNGKVSVSGTPWRGKEGYGIPGVKELSGIAFLERATENSAEPINPDAVLIKFATQAYIPKKDVQSGKKALALLNRVLCSVPLISLKCNMREEAAQVAHDAFCKAEALMIEIKSSERGENHEQ